MLCVYPLAFHTAGEAGETDLEPVTKPHDLGSLSPEPRAGQNPSVSPGVAWSQTATLVLAPFVPSCTETFLWSDHS